MNKKEFQRGWTGGLPETVCGYGSKVNQTKVQRKTLAGWIKKYQIQSVVDVGAGDLNWVGLMNLDIKYQPLDLVPRSREVKPFDLIYQTPPACDMVWCLWLLNHLPDHHARNALHNLLKTDCKYIVYTWWKELPDFQDLGALESAVIRSNHKTTYELRLIKC